MPVFFQPGIPSGPHFEIPEMEPDILPAAKQHKSLYVPVVSASTRRENAPIPVVTHSIPPIIGKFHEPRQFRLFAKSLIHPAILHVIPPAEAIS